MKNYWIYSIIGVILVVAVGFFISQKQDKSVVDITPEPTGTPVVHADWKTIASASGKIAFQYPETIPTIYIHTVDWPPKIQVVSGPLMCTQAGSEIARGGKTEQRTVNGNTYCITVSSEGAAGSIYNQYAYAFSQENKTIILTFTLRLVQCANYDQLQQQACQAERTSFNPDTIIDEIAQTIHIASS